MQCNLPPMRRPPMFEKINALPGPQSETAAHEGDRELSAGQRGADVGRHIVGALVRMPIPARLFGRQTVEKRLQIGANVWRSVFLNEQSGRGMSAKEGQKPSLEPMRLEPVLHFVRDLNERSSAR